MDGECNAGPDCKFAHPVDDDDDEESFTPSEASTPSFYDPMESYSPLSPLYPNPLVHWQPAPPLPVAVMPYTPHTFVENRGYCWEPRLLDGNTLRSRENSLVASDETVAPPSATSTDASNLASARSIVRSMSTPPSARVSTVSNVRVCGFFDMRVLCTDSSSSCSKQRCPEDLNPPSPFSFPCSLGQIRKLFAFAPSHTGLIAIARTTTLLCSVIRPHSHTHSTFSSAIPLLFPNLQPYLG